VLHNLPVSRIPHNIGFLQVFADEVRKNYNFVQFSYSCIFARRQNETTGKESDKSQKIFWLLTISGCFGPNISIIKMLENHSRKV